MEKIVKIDQVPAESRFNLNVDVTLLFIAGGKKFLYFFKFIEVFFLKLEFIDRFYTNIILFVLPGT